MSASQKLIFASSSMRNAAATSMDVVGMAQTLKTSTTRRASVFVNGFALLRVALT